jgi:hypothetical protein
MNLKGGKDERSGNFSVRVEEGKRSGRKKEIALGTFNFSL